MANDKQIKSKTKYVGTRGVEEYRQSISVWVQPKDIVLEIGCGTGTTTEALAQCCKRVVGTDVSEEILLLARQRRPDLQFETLDAFDVRAALELSQRLGVEFDKVYIDMSGISGYRSLLDLLALLNMYSTILRPQAIIVKSGALKHLAQHIVAWQRLETSP